MNEKTKFIGINFVNSLKILTFVQVNSTTDTTSRSSRSNNYKSTNSMDFDNTDNNTDIKIDSRYADEDYDRVEYNQFIEELERDEYDEDDDIIYQ